MRSGKRESKPFKVGVGRVSPNQPGDFFSRPEEKILLCCAHTASEAEKRSRLKRLLASDLDWEYLFSQAEKHGLLCLLLRSLGGLKKLVPEPILDRLQEYYRFSLDRSIRLTRKLFEVLDLAERQGVRILPLKGPPLAVLLYGELALRPTGDVDVLVSAADWETLDQTLIDSGCEAAETNRGGSSASSPKDLFHSVYIDRDGLRVELHWALAQPDLGFLYSFEELWEESRTIYLAGRQVSFLGPEQSLLVLCLHLGRHGWRRLLWLRDIASSANQESIDWEKLLRLSRLYGAERTLLPSLKLAKELLGARVPERVPVQDLRPRILSAWAVSLFFADSSRISVGVREHLLALALRKHLLQKMRYLLRGFGIVDWHLGSRQRRGQHFVYRLLSLLKKYRSRPDPGRRLSGG